MEELRKESRRRYLRLFALALLSKLLLAALSTVICYFAGVRESEPLLVLGQTLAVLGDIFLPVVICCADIAAVRERMGLEKPLGLDLLLWIALLLVESALGVGIAALLCRVGLSDMTFTEFRVNLPVYVLGLLLELLAEIAILLVLLLLCRRKKGEKPIFRKGSGYRSLALTAIWVRLALEFVVRLSNGFADFGVFLEIVDAYGFASPEGVTALLRVLVMPLFYYLVTVFAVRQLSLQYAAKIAEEDAE